MVRTDIWNAPIMDIINRQIIKRSEALVHYNNAEFYLFVRPSI